MFDSKLFSKIILTSLISKLQMKGKKESLEIIIKQNLSLIKKFIRINPNFILFSAVYRTRPFCEIKSLKIGGKLYKIPMEIKSKKQKVLVFKWLFNSISLRNEHFLEMKIMKEILDTYNFSSKTLDYCENFHKLSEINKIYMQYRF